MTPKGMFDPSADAVAFGVLKERSAHVSRRVGVEGRPGSYLRWSNRRVCIPPG